MTKYHSQTPRKVASKFTKRVSQAIYEAPWYWSLLNLAWTAGPVTYIALQGGYHFGYGKSAAPELFLYFAIYTIITGLMAAIASAIRYIIIKPRKEKAQQDLTNTIDQLFLLYFAVRNEYLKTYSKEDRATVAAWWSCRSAHTDVDVLEEAIRDVTEDDDLAYAMKRIEFYRHQGFTDLMKAEYLKHEDKITEFIGELSQKFPGLAEKIQQRFEGNAPTIRYGQSRVAGFVERLIAMDNDDDPRLATADDILAILHLTIELLLGRVIITLYPKFNGYRKLDDARENFDRLISDFRLIRRKRNGSIRALIMDISDDKSKVQIAKANSAQLQNLMFDLLGNIQDKQLGKRRYIKILALNDQLNKLWKKLSEKERIYNKQWQKDGTSLQKSLSKNSSPSKKDNTLFIKEYEIKLKNRQKMHLVKEIQTLLQSSSTTANIDDYKRIAALILNMLDDIINISEPEEQLSIEASREADFGCIEPGLAAQTKLGWGRIMVEEVQEARTQISTRLAARLTNYFNITLGPDIIDYFVDEYGASREVLEKLQISEMKHDNNASETLRRELLDLPKWDDLQR